MPDLGAYLSQVVSHWVSAISGIVAIAVAIIGHFWGKRPSARFWVDAGLVFFLIASLQTGFDLFQRTHQLQAKEDELGTAEKTLGEQVELSRESDTLHQERNLFEAEQLRAKVGDLENEVVTLNRRCANGRRR